MNRSDFLFSTSGCRSHEWKLEKNPSCSQVQLIPNCFEKKDRFPFHNTATVNTSFYLTSFSYGGLLKWSHAVIKIFWFCNFAFSTLFVKVLRKIPFSQASHEDKHVPSLQHEVEFYRLQGCQNSERIGDSLINERNVHIETVKTLFYRQNSHENVLWKAAVYSFHLNYSVLSDSIAQMWRIQLKFNCSAIDTIWKKLISFQPIRSEYLRQQYY